MSKKISVLFVVMSSLLMASCLPQGAPFEPQQWVGDYELINPLCKTTVKFASGPESVSARYVSLSYNANEDLLGHSSELTIIARPLLSDESPKVVDNYFNINGKSYISANTCLADGGIYQSTVVASNDTIAEQVEELDHNVLCLPSHTVKASYEKKIAERHGDFLMIYGCTFKKLAPATEETETPASVSTDAPTQN
jgi:hypothetical protein